MQGKCTNLNVIHIKINKCAIIPLLLQLVIMYKWLSSYKIQMFNLWQEKNRPTTCTFFAIVVNKKNVSTLSSCNTACQQDYIYMYISRIRLALKGTVIMVKGARNTTLDYLTTCLLLHAWKHKKLN